MNDILEAAIDYFKMNEVYYGLDEERSCGEVADIVTRKTKESLDVPWGKMDNASV